MGRHRGILGAILILGLMAGLLPGAVHAGVFGKDVEDVFDKIQTNVADPKARVRFLPENTTSWYTRWQILDNAKQSIDLTYFIVEPDIFGMSMLGMLLKKAREGVAIRIMLDARGTKGLTRKLMGQDVLQELIKYDNVQIRVFNPVHRRFLALFDDIRKIMASNHDKIILVDGRYLITGGRNISKSYFVDPRDCPTVYRDTDVVVESEIVAAQTRKAFEEEFAQGGNFNVYEDLFGNIDQMHRKLDFAYHAMRRWLYGMGMAKVDPKQFDKDTVKILTRYQDELKQYRHLQDMASFRLFQGEHQMPARVLDKHSLMGPRNDITTNLIAMIDAAKREILIQNPYVVLTPVAEAALNRANDRGVRIVIQTNSPMSTDSLLTQAMFLGDWKRILKEMPKVEIYGYKLENKLHSKVFVFDRQVAVIGSYNMDYVSEQINSEMVLAVRSRPFAEQVARRIGEDIKNSHRYEIKVEADGKVTTVYGPETHSDPDVINRLNWLQKLHWMRPLI